MLSGAYQVISTAFPNIIYLHNHINSPKKQMKSTPKITTYTKAINEYQAKQLTYA